MVTAFVVLFFLAIWHLLYEAVIAPSTRMHFRNELFKLRDRLRKVAIDNNSSSNFDEDIFEYIHDGINRFLNRLPYLNPLEIRTAAKAIENNSNLRERIEERMRAIENCGNDEMISVWRETSLVVAKVMIANVGGWAIYVVPIFVFVHGLGLGIATLQRFVNDLMIAPQHAVKEFLAETAPPNDSTVTV